MFDQRSGLLYVSLRQTFALWFIPLYKAPVRLVTVLQLTQSGETASRNSLSEGGRDSSALSGLGQERAKYYIASQEDLYPVNDCLQFLLPGLGPLLWFVWQVYSAWLCLLGSLVLFPLYLVLNRPKEASRKTNRLETKMM